MKKIIFKNKHKSGFVILFAVTVSSILLAIALGVGNVAYKEIQFGTSAKDTNEAFFAADTAIEYALFQDKSTVNAYSPAPGTWPFNVAGLGGSGQSCAKVTVTKTVSPAVTDIVSKGYNIGDGSCDSSSMIRIERQLEVSYEGEAISWTFCANEDGFCAFSGTKQVRYGANGTYNYLDITDGTSCDNATFGDPISGVPKHCDYAL